MAAPVPAHQNDILAQNNIFTTLSKKYDLAFKDQQTPAPHDMDLPWDLRVQSQVLATSTDRYQSDVRAFILTVKVSNDASLEVKWNLAATIPERKGTFLLRSNTISLAKDIEVLKDAEVSYLRIEQCPHAFAPLMIRHCEVYVANRGWTLLSKPAEIELLLKYAGQVWHDVERDMPRYICKQRRKLFESDWEGLLQSGSLGVLYETLIKTADPDPNDRIDNWLDDLPHHEEFDKDRMPQWESYILFGDFRNWELEPEAKEVDWVHALNISLLEDNLKAPLQKNPKVKPATPEGGYMTYEALVDPLVLLVQEDPHQEGKLEVEKLYLSELNMQIMCYGVSPTVRYLPRMMYNSRAGQYLDRKLLALEALVDIEAWMTSIEFNDVLVYFVGRATTPMLKNFDRLLLEDLKDCEKTMEADAGTSYHKVFSIRPDWVEVDHPEYYTAPEPMSATPLPLGNFRRKEDDGTDEWNQSLVLYPTWTPIPPSFWDHPAAPAPDCWIRLCEQKESTKGTQKAVLRFQFPDPLVVAERRSVAMEQAEQDVEMDIWLRIVALLAKLKQG